MKESALSAWKQLILSQKEIRQILLDYTDNYGQTIGKSCQIQIIKPIEQKKEKNSSNSILP
jgi:hypothetical protein